MNLKIVTTAVMVLLATTNLYANHVKDVVPFTTDGCSSFPDGFNTGKDNFKQWRHCCVKHDFDYYAGGTKLAKNISDSKLSQCVSKALNSDKVTRTDKIFGNSMGRIMLDGVKVGGLPKFLMFKSQAGYRWGYGVPNNNGFLDINSNEIHEKLRLELIEFSDFLENKETSSNMQISEAQFLEIKQYLKKKINFMGTNNSQTDTRFKNNITK